MKEAIVGHGSPGGLIASDSPGPQVFPNVLRCHHREQHVMYSTEQKLWLQEYSHYSLYQSQEQCATLA